jgi:hypothetical protein
MLRPVSPPPSDLRPLALGEIIDRAATFWRLMLYLDLRVRREGLDLERRLEAR